MRTYEFRHDPRLGIELPHLDKDWDDYGEAEQAEILAEWEQIRGKIPERVKELERQIQEKLALMNEETDFAACCRLNAEIAELASRINDLLIWFRINQEVGPAKPHG